ncbi:MAG TPA: LamG domain-containing protein, partial [Candidatus Marinimicrobia bacterium]|nr:LamG domain-containing protein [Candidatus Neomarinimicrobiota bacterium]
NAGQTNNWDVSGSDGSDIAYTLNLVQATTISVTTCAAYSDYDTKLEIFTATGECVATTTSYFNDDYSCTYSGLRSTLPSCVLASGKYYIVVDGYAGATGNYQVDIAEVSGRNENGNNNADGDLPGIFDSPNFTSTAGYDDDYEINKLRADGFTPLEIQQLLNETADDPSSASRTGGTGTPRITMETGAADSAAYYVSGTGTATISFQYVILSGDSTSDLDYVSTTALEANSGTIRDAAGNDATLTLPTPGSTGSLAANKALIIDGIGPLVSSVSSTAPDSTYNVGSMLPITITFNEIVVVTGTPQLTLETGASDAVVDYVSGSGTTTLTFNYTSTTGENSSDLDYQDTTALVLNGGSITDSFGNVANLILPLPGSAGSLGANKAIIIDGGAPIVYTITSTAADGTYNLGDIIPITITFSDAITVTGVPHLEINTGGTSLSFDGNGDYVRMAGFNPSTTDFALSLWVKSHAASNYNKNIFHQMDGSGTGRNILGIKYSGNDEFFTFLGGGNRYSGFVPEINRWYNVVLVHNNSGNTLTWYINGVEKNTNSANVESTVGDFLIGVHKNFGSNTYFNGLVDEVSIWNNTLDSSEIIGLYNNGISISAAANSGDYTSADHLIRYYTMDEGYGSAIIDRSTSNIDGTIYNATWGPSPLRGDTVSYSSGSGASALIFNYIVANGQQTADLDYTRTDALFLNGGTIKEPSGNDAILSLPLPGTTGSLGVDKDIVVDGKVPAVTAVTSPTVDGSYSLGESIAITITLDEVVTVTGTPQLTLETGTSDATVNYASGSGTSLLTFNYTIAEGDTNSDLAYQGTNALALNSGTIRDAAGNDASLTLPTPGATGSLSAVKALVIDGVVPTITNVTSNAADSTYNVGDTLDIIVQFSETMTVGTASLGCGDFLINSLPFTAQYSNAGQTNNWDVSGSDGSDIAYTLNLVQATTISV